MRFSIPAVAMATLTLFACSKPTARYQEYSDAAAAPAAEAVELKPAPASDGASAAIMPSAGPMLAYSYQFGLEAPPAKIRGLVDRHEQACRAAGFVQCQVTGSTYETGGPGGRDSVHATLSMRATPSWLSRFRAGLGQDARGAGGRVIKTAVTSEDLTREIVDVQAQVKAKVALRDRLQAILETRPGKTADLVEVETALSKVQGELDAISSNLTQMRQRVTTSDITIGYDSSGVMPSDDAWLPLHRAFAEFLSTAIFAIAFMVQTVAFLLPWALLVGALLLIFRKRLRGLSWPWRRERREGPPAG